MARWIASVTLLFTVAAAPAQETGWSAASRIEVALANFKFMPATITLHHGNNHGAIELDGGDSADIRLTAPAAPGSYKVHCSHFMHAAFGMKGTIVVD